LIPPTTSSLEIQVLQEVRLPAQLVRVLARDMKSDFSIRVTGSTTRVVDPPFAPVSYTG
jgi:hypothetical protein